MNYISNITMIPTSKFDVIGREVLRQCDGQDGLVDVSLDFFLHLTVRKSRYEFGSLENMLRRSSPILLDATSTPKRFYAPRP